MNARSPPIVSTAALTGEHDRASPVPWDTGCLETMPTLYSIRMWTAEVNPSYITFMDELRAHGHDVVDIFVSHDGFATLDEWAGGVVDRLLECWTENTPLHLIGYCGGGDLLITALPILERRGIRADYVGFIDIRNSPQSFSLERGLYSLYQVPWSGRLWRQIMRITPPDRESVVDVSGSILRRSVRSVIELPTRGWRSTRRRNPAIHEQIRLEYLCDWPGVTTPAHLYVCAHSVDRYVPGDPSAGISRTLLGGFVIRSISGTHETCIEPPHSTALIERISADRRAVLDGVGAFH